MSQDCTFVQMNIYEKSLFQLLEENEVPVFAETIVSSVAKLSQSYLALLHEIYLALGGNKESIPKVNTLLVQRDFIDVNGKALIVDEPVHFNRYRLQTLRSSYYDDAALSWKLDDYKRFCRKYEPEAIKSGSVSKIWTTDLSVELFGASNDLGDLSGTGSSGWKLTALRDALLDLHADQQGVKLIRYPMNATIMIKGELQNFGKLLLFGDKKLRPLCFKLLSRAIGII